MDLGPTLRHSQFHGPPPGPLTGCSRDPKMWKHRGAASTERGDTKGGREPLAEISP
jgi:hypothetical protein